ncbi:FecCD family ABC transporter permease [Actinomyces minihominis]|uniref:FecCD family ABC transporter permease n=1 Tax=Actinomyces minihominis TaxID=2002838 RepID=UPI001F5D805A|nr:iron ABC transporter permease [Actinomyces minihominis]
MALVLVLVVLSVSTGSRQVTFDEIYAGVTGSAQTIAEVAVAKRVPRTFLALLVGGSLALAGLGMQAVTRNPLADPGIFGISNGASLAVVLGMVFLGTSNPYLQMGLAVLGAAVAAVLVFIIGSAGPGGASPLKLALSGAATAAALASLISIVLLPRVEMLQNYQFWQIGGVGGATWDKVATITPVLAVAALATWALSRRMNALALGDDMARGLGESVWASRVYIALAAVTLAGVATAVAGPIGFVGLVIPHFCRLITGPDYRMLVPFSMLTGGALLLGADIVGRIVARPQEIQVGILTALIGAPFFVWIVRRQKIREL